MVSGTRRRLASAALAASLLAADVVLIALILNPGVALAREALRLADAFRARVVDATHSSFVFELTGKSAKIEQFIALMQPLGLKEVVRTGIAAINRGPDAMRI